MREGFLGITGCNGCDRTRRVLTIARERSGRGDEGVDIRKGKCCCWGGGSASAKY